MPLGILSIVAERITPNTGHMADRLRIQSGHSWIRQKTPWIFLPVSGRNGFPGHDSSMYKIIVNAFPHSMHDFMTSPKALLRVLMYRRSARGLQYSHGPTPGMPRSTCWMTVPYGVTERPCCTDASCKVRRNLRSESFVQSRPARCNVSKALHIPVFVPHQSNARTSVSGNICASDGRARFLLSMEDDDAIAEDDAKR